MALEQSPTPWTSVTVADKLAFLRTPGRLDTVVETIETHLSWVFLTAHRVYKLKKPVAMPYLDHRALAQRERSVRKEAALGPRLAPDVYLGTIPLVASPRGLSLGGRGEIVDWLVVMRRLPATAMLPYALARGVATDADADAVGDVLAAFYATTARSAWSPTAYQRRMHDLVTSYAIELVTCGAAHERLARLTTALLVLVDRHADALVGRVAAGRIVDAHGDLRPEHVCLEAPPVVIDPLEFDDDLRTLDAASELAFFAMECDRLGASWFGERVVARYAARTGDRPPPALVALYVGQHALARALIALRHVPDAPPSDHARWRAKADDYLARAEAAVRP